VVQSRVRVRKNGRSSTLGSSVSTTKHEYLARYVIRIARARPVRHRPGR
jgi:hypothetical protein